MLQLDPQGVGNQRERVHEGFVLGYFRAFDVAATGKVVEVVARIRCGVYVVEKVCGRSDASYRQAYFLGAYVNNPS